MPSQPSILIAVLRYDLRVVDHPIFHLAHTGSLGSRVTHVLPVYVFDERQIELEGVQDFRKANPNKHAQTRVGKFWKCNVHRTRFLHETLVDLQGTLEKLGSKLEIFFGQPEKIVPAIVKQLQDRNVAVEGVWMAHENASEELQVEQRLSTALENMNSALHLVESRRTMIHPEDLPFDPKGKHMPDIYTGFRQKVEALGEKMVRAPWPAPEKFKPPPEQDIAIENTPGAMQLPPSTPLKDILPQLLQPLQAEQADSSPEKSDIPYRGGLTAGEKRLKYYTDGKNAPIATYKDTRNGLLGTDFSTKFSPWLAHGALSPKFIYQRVEEWESQYGASKNSYWVKFELLWRDFFTFLLDKHGNAFFYLSGLGLPQQEAPTDSGNAKGMKKGKTSDGRSTIDGYWLCNDWEQGKESDVQKWCYGTTGIPFIDANMREIKETGYMSNRGRQNVFSFFTKDMGHQDWRVGAEWFESYLLDYDISSNWGNAQYQAGVGVDPRSSRQFNIVKQGKDYDSKGAFVAHWVPKLAEVYRKHNVDLGMIHHPWTISVIQDDLQKDEDLKIYAQGNVKYEQKSWKSHYNRSKEDGKGSGGGRGRGGHRGSGRGRNPGPRGSRNPNARPEEPQQ